jgi:pyruvate/2-oxoglutarate dehydrogenase complex dihydrolipoamide acyltransferase (E2) component
MAKAYTPGLKVSSRTTYRARRQLPVHGEVLVKAGDMVKARDVVARTFIEGEVTPVAVASQLGVPAGDLASLMLVKQGDAVTAGQTLARSKGIFGLGKKEVASPAAGTVESISTTTGQMILRGAPIPVEVKAYIDGRVTEVFAGEGALVAHAPGRHQREAEGAQLPEERLGVESAGVAKTRPDRRAGEREDASRVCCVVEVGAGGVLAG